MIVMNPKGRVACIVAAIVWCIPLTMLLIRGDWSLGPSLLLLLFALLLGLSILRIYQEWKEDGEWLD